MKTTILTTVFCILSIVLWAQFPQSFKYQAVVRDQAGQIMENKAVLFRISILAGSGTGVLIYRESHTTVSTNAFGLATLDVGKGVADQGTFSSINWGSGEHYLKVEVYTPGSSGWQDMGTTQLLSVPYALYARDVMNNNDADASPVNEIQKLSLSGTVLTLDNGGGSVTLPVSGTGGDNWGTQVVKTNPTLAGQGTDASLLGVVNSELQPDWSKVQNKPAGFADNVDNVDDADNSPTNEIQTLTLAGNTLGISNGNTVTLPPATGDNWGSEVIHTTTALAGQGTTASPLDIARQSATTGQVLKWDGSSWKPAPDEVSGGSGTNPVGPAGGDLAGTYPNPAIGDGKVTSAKVLDGTITNADLSDNSVNSVKILDASVNTADLAKSSVTTDKIAVNAVTTDRINAGAVNSDIIANNAVTTDKINAGAVTGVKISQSGATSGQVLKWNGTIWAPATDETGTGGGTNPVGPAGGDLAGTYPNPQIGDGKVTSAKILDGTIANADLVDNSVNSAKISDNSVANADLADNSVNSAKIQDASVATADLANSAVNTDKLGNLAVSTDKIQNSAVTSDKLANNAVTTDKINAGAVTGNRIAQAGAIPGQALKWNGTIWAPADDATGAGGLTLPWSGSTSTGTGGYAFTVISSGQDIGALSGKQTNNAISSGGNGVYGEAAAPFGNGVSGKSTGMYGIGIYGEGYIGVKARGDVKGIMANSSGTGVEGRTSSSTGYGLAGYSPSCGVYGESWITNGYGIFGKSTGDPYDDITCGVYGEANTENAYGVKGFVSNTIGRNYGIYGESKSSFGFGVFGTSPGYGVCGQSAGSLGTGVYGKSTGFQGVAVWGEATAGNSIGVKGIATNGNSTGVYGEGAKQGIYGISANIGAYATSTGYKGKAVLGEATGTNSVGIQGTATSSNSTGVWGEGDNQGVYGVSALATGKGVYGAATSSSGANFGMYGESASSAGYGVYGKAPLYGVYGISNGANGYGLFGKSTSNTGYGVYGEAQKIGVYGVASLSNASGVYGEAPKYGVYGFSTAASGYGVYGISSASSGYGLYGESPLYGAYAKSTGNTGRALKAEATGTGSIGLWGVALGDNSTGVYGQGDNFDFYAAGPGVNYGDASSIRWKRNIELIPDPVGKIMAIRGVYFDWDTEHGGKHDVGMIAEEVGKVLPEIVVYEENGVDASGMDYSKITPLLVEAVKALKAENDKLKERLEKLEKLAGESKLK